MFPELTGTEAAVTQSEAAPVPWTYRFNWETGQLLQGPDGRYLRTTSYEQFLEETAKKILHTQRFRYAIYSERYGVDFLTNRGRLRSGISLAVIKAQVQEALEAHKEIERAEVLDIRFEGNRVVLQGEIVGSRGSTKVEVNAWQR
ncbi:DUF2634 domain-containing protein [Brevibacillus nitrificans]|uniref:DUF2634 domain-containing protein n=1 Tax=Brevibacillus nitrificans TaxID=651560 RepID=A0A3M8D049_9BACL|nr:DUF2634 domain-containing protein [Brevibacillus nitrificans]RNB81089.1 DUF2634 domain-containing protein [Brevibacillus nitrificans]